MPPRWPVLIFMLAAAAASAAEPDEALELFEREVRPILVDTCQKCHGPDKQESDLRLDSREAAGERRRFRARRSCPGDRTRACWSRRFATTGDMKMPPKSKLTEAQIAAVDALGQARRALARVDKSRPDNQRRAARTTGPSSRSAIRRCPCRGKSDIRRIRSTPSFARSCPNSGAESLAAGRSPHAHSPGDARPDRPAADAGGSRRLRRATTTRDAYERLIDRLLASPHYGEHWGRHWLDVARYSDTKGYVYAREQRFWVHAWVYRDWVVRALNDDLPYDRFLLLQIAADQAAPGRHAAALAAMGFLTLGRRFLGVTHDIIDDRIDVVTRGTMGLTVACARCHDHKYDPIPTRDYYSLYGVFQSCAERIVPIAEPPARDAAYRRSIATELTSAARALADDAGRSGGWRRPSGIGRRVGDYLAAQLELHKYPEEGFDQILAKDGPPAEFRPPLAGVSDGGQEAAAIRSSLPWHAFAEFPPARVRRQGGRSHRDAGRAASGRSPSARAAKVPPAAGIACRRSPPATASCLPTSSGSGRSCSRSRAEQAAAAAGRCPMPRPKRCGRCSTRPTAPCEVPDEPIVNIEYVFDSGSCNALWKLQNEVDNWMLQSPPRHAAHASCSPTATLPTTPRVFKRGNPANKGEEVPRQFVEVLAGPNRQPFAHGSGRLELAQAIIDPANPLTARVIVNRVWLHHFGAGLVRTPSDFGTRAEPPSHPELLDWLTSRFIADGWSLKKLHRRIMLSADVPAKLASGRPTPS